MTQGVIYIFEYTQNLCPDGLCLMLNFSSILISLLLKAVYGSILLFLFLSYCTCLTGTNTAAMCRSYFVFVLFYFIMFFCFTFSQVIRFMTPAGSCWHHTQHANTMAMNTVSIGIGDASSQCFYLTVSFRCCNDQKIIYNVTLCLLT